MCVCLTCEELEQRSHGNFVASKLLSSIILDWGSKLDSEPKITMYQKMRHCTTSNCKNLILLRKISAELSAVIPSLI